MRLQIVPLVLVSVAACQANTIVILAATGLPAADENGNYGSSGATYNGFAIATVNGVQNQWILCDDAEHTTNVPSGNMVYDFSSIGGNNPLQSVRFTDGPLLQNYEEAAVLTWQLFGYMSAKGAQASGDTITDYQYAVWNIFDPGGIKVDSNQSSLQTNALNLMNTQSAMLVSSVYPNVKVYTPDPNGGSTSNQEFLQYSAPEPGTLALFAGALLMATMLAARGVARVAQGATGDKKEPAALPGDHPLE